MPSISINDVPRKDLRKMMRDRYKSDQDTDLLRRVLEHSNNGSSLEGVIHFMSDELRDKLANEVKAYHHKYRAYPTEDSRFLRGYEKHDSYQFNKKQLEKEKVI